MDWARSRSWWPGSSAPARGPRRPAIDHHSKQEGTMSKPDRTRRLMAACTALWLLAPAAMAQSREQAASPPALSHRAHRLALQVNTNEPAAMNLALNNASNVEQF